MSASATGEAADGVAVTVEQLREIVRRHRVCYEVWPECLVVKGTTTKVGFLLELNGTNADHADDVLPACVHCRRTFEDLLQIAEWIVPKDQRPSYCDVESYDNAVRETAKRAFRPEVVLGIKILHRCGFDQPVDVCEELCLKEMKQKLSELGVNDGSWSEEEIDDRTG